MNLPTLRRRPKSRLPAAAAVAAAALFAAAPGTPARAGQANTTVDKGLARSVGATEEETTKLDSFQVDASYVGSSDFRIKQFDGAGPLQSQREFGSQDEFHETLEYSHRFKLRDRIYLRAGVNYERFDFGTTFAPVPTTLQSISGVIALEYVVQNRPAIFLQSKPGVYFSHVDDIKMASFDAPTVLGVTFEASRIFSSLKNVYLIVGVRGSILGRYPVLPIGGLVWVIRDNLRLELVPPEPRLIYSFSKALDVFVGAELLGESYRRDRNENARPQDQRFNNAIIDYSEIRAGGGLTFTPNRVFDIDLSGGVALNREFNYYRGDGKRFITEPAPYAKISIKAQF